MLIGKLVSQPCERLLDGNRETLWPTNHRRCYEGVYRSGAEASRTAETPRVLARHAAESAHKRAAELPREGGPAGWSERLQARMGAGRESGREKQECRARTPCAAHFLNAVRRAGDRAFRQPARSGTPPTTEMNPGVQPPREPRIARDGEHQPPAAAELRDREAELGRFRPAFRPEHDPRRARQAADRC